MPMTSPQASLTSLSFKNTPELRFWANSIYSREASSHFQGFRSEEQSKEAVLGLGIDHA